MIRVRRLVSESVLNNVVRAVFPIGIPCIHTRPRFLCVVFKESPAALMGRRYIGIEEILRKRFPSSLLEFCTDEGQHVLTRIFRFSRVNYLLPSILIF